MDQAAAIDADAVVVIQQAESSEAAGPECLELLILVVVVEVEPG